MFQIKHLAHLLKWKILFLHPIRPFVCQSVCLSVRYQLISGTIRPIHTKLCTHTPWMSTMNLCPKIPRSVSWWRYISPLYVLAYNSWTIGRKIKLNFPWIPWTMSMTHLSTQSTPIWANIFRIFFKTHFLPLFLHIWTKCHQKRYTWSMDLSD